MPSSPTPSPVRSCAALFLGIALSGCVLPGDRPPGQADPDGRLCSSATADAVYLEVRYAADGMPSVEPAVCTINRGTRVTWRGPTDTPVDFAIRFKGDSPVANEPRGMFVAKRGADRHRVQRVLDGPPGRYDYAVVANGRELDPAIIIR